MPLNMLSKAGLGQLANVATVFCVKCTSCEYLLSIRHLVLPTTLYNVFTEIKVYMMNKLLYQAWSLWHSISSNHICLIFIGAVYWHAHALFILCIFTNRWENCVLMYVYDLMLSLNLSFKSNCQCMMSSFSPVHISFHISCFILSPNSLHG